MLNFYSIETEVKYRIEQMNKALPRVEINQKNTVWSMFKELYTRFITPKTPVDCRTNYECQCTC